MSLLIILTRRARGEQALNHRGGGRERGVHLLPYPSLIRIKKLGVVFPSSWKEEEGFVVRKTRPLGGGGGGKGFRITGGGGEGGPERRKVGILKFKRHGKTRKKSSGSRPAGHLPSQHREESRLGKAWLSGRFSRERKQVTGARSEKETQGPARTASPEKKGGGGGVVQVRAGGGN